MKTYCICNTDGPFGKRLTGEQSKQPRCNPVTSPQFAWRDWEKHRI